MARTTGMDQPLLPMRLPVPAPEGLPEGLAVGTEVGAGLIPYHASHPDCWQRPWKGVVLALDDVRAWAGSLAFPDENPEQLAVSAHVRWCLDQGLLRGKVPVAWEFGKVHWERPQGLRTVEADLVAFEKERAAARR